MALIEDLCRYATVQVETHGIGGHPMLGDTETASSFIVARRARAVLATVIPNAPDPTPLVCEEDQQLNSLVHLYLSDATLWMFRRILKHLGGETIARALDAIPQINFPFSCLALPATLVSVAMIGKKST